MSTSRALTALLCTLALASSAALSAAPAGAASIGTRVRCVACYVVADGDTVLFARAAERPRPNASTTKMVTALVVVGRVAPDEMVRVSAGAAAAGGGGLDLSLDDVYPVEALLYAMLLSSSNDAAVALAEHVAGSEEAFVAIMNRRARTLGATATRYVTSHGLDTPGHASSARDLALIATRLLDDPLLARIVATPEIEISGPRGTTLLENRNPLLESYRGATGVKTGFTAGAGNVLVASAERNGRRAIAVAMGSVDAGADAAALLDHAWARLHRTVLLRERAPVGALVFEAGSTAVVAADRVRGPIDRNDIDVVFTPRAGIAAPVAPGDVVGQVKLSGPRGVVASVDAVATEAVEASRTSWAATAVAALLRIGSLVAG